MIKRSIGKVVEELNNRYPVLLLTGASETGKDTLLQQLNYADREIISLSDKSVRTFAEKLPAEFVKNLTPPVLLKEIQYGLNLMPYINQYVSQSKENGQFWLVGTHMCDLFDNEGASLGENIGIAKIPGLCYEEITGVDINLYNINFYEVNTIKNQILRGSMPGLYGEGSFRNKENYFDEVIQEFLRIEVKSMAKVSNVMQFRKFMEAVAKRSGQLLNYANLSKDAEISQPTAKQWLSILLEGGMVGLLKPYHHESLKRVVDVPRLFFMDTGLCAYLGNIKKAEKLFKTWVISEIFKNFYNLGIIPPISFYRDKDGKEVDLIIEDGDVIHPIKIEETLDIYETEKVYFNGFAKKGIPVAAWKTISISKK